MGFSPLIYTQKSNLSDQPPNTLAHRLSPEL